MTTVTMQRVGIRGYSDRLLETRTETPCCEGVMWQ